uniref:Uncharacterized protein n=1 Tax=Oryza punctata TaxID=4537 RepID=A0A0E0ML44_ORYPU
MAVAEGRGGAHGGGGWRWPGGRGDKWGRQPAGAWWWRAWPGGCACRGGRLRRGLARAGGKWRRRLMAGVALAGRRAGWRPGAGARLAASVAGARGGVGGRGAAGRSGSAHDLATRRCALAAHWEAAGTSHAQGWRRLGRVARSGAHAGGGEGCRGDGVKAAAVGWQWQRCVPWQYRAKTGSASREMQRGGRKTKEGGRRRCSPRGSRAAARREWPTASTIGSRFILGLRFVLAR